MALQAPWKTILGDALASRHEESFERALGRAVRRHGGGYADYVDLIGRVRARAESQKTDLREAARELRDQP